MCMGDWVTSMSFAASTRVGDFGALYAADAKGECLQHALPDIATALCSMETCSTYMPWQHGLVQLLHNACPGPAVCLVCEKNGRAANYILTY